MRHVGFSQPPDLLSPRSDNRIDLAQIGAAAVIAFQVGERARLRISVPGVVRLTIPGRAENSPYSLQALPGLDYAEILRDLKAAVLRVGDIHVQPKVVLTGNHFGRTAGSF